MTVKLEWATPDIDKKIGYIARVSNPSNQSNENIQGLIKYMITNGHVSPFEMANACFEIKTTRDIARQILRHRSFSFQEFSQRYADVTQLGELEFKQCRLQDTKNRQNSIPVDVKNNDKHRWLAYSWERQQQLVQDAVTTAYTWALENGIAKEQARAVLPEGMTSSTLYMNGTLRSWIHYLKQRLDPSTQLEHQQLAKEILQELYQIAPITIGACLSDYIHNNN
ncbi:THY1 Predicted alternative thymidylate synthase [uncultured Caudovirales phage]|uniref:THY1 Predicted alternative thymidylate synthase n=1 Tax=uncultured Caudovirales phage TaxID=2100421 RepID=A0A6J7WKW5_9CAUD|nr:THY1 Predicted alternative thymidylate synthase [uncultured Caudovirales phage]